MTDNFEFERSEEQTKEINKYLSDIFDYDNITYSKLDFRGAAVVTIQQVDLLVVNLVDSLNNLQLIYGGVSAIGIAIGFLMLNTGTISQKNTKTMLRVSLIENMICAFGMWVLGYRIAMDSIGGLIGTGLDFDFFHSVSDESCNKFIILFACAQFTSAITTGALAERTYVDTQIAFKVMLNVLIFPIVSSWVWGGGWLAKWGYQDFGGSGFHIVGGTCGLVGAFFLGPRLGLFQDSLPLQENKIREKIEKLEHMFQNMRVDSEKKYRELQKRVYVYQMLKQGHSGADDMINKDNIWLEDQKHFVSHEMIEATVNEIYRKSQKSQDHSEFEQMKMERSSSVPKQLKRGHKKALHTKPKNKTKHNAVHQASDFVVSGSSSSDDALPGLAIETKFLIVNYLKTLPTAQRRLVRQITKLESDITSAIRKQQEILEKLDRLTKKYVSVFRMRNPELRHFKAQQIKDYSDILVKESQNLRQPNSTILVAGGVLFIFFGTLSLSILIARVFYVDNNKSNSSKLYLAAAGQMMEIGFDSMIDKLSSVSGSVITVLLIKPLVYGAWRTVEQTSCVYNVETVSSSIIAGISSVAGASGYIEIHDAVIIGGIGGLIYLFGSLLLNRFQLDDPLQATQTHLFCGLWGVIAFGLVHKEKGLLTTGNGRFLGIQIAGASIILIFTAVLTIAFFVLVKKRFHLRLSKVEEVLGLDCQEDDTQMQLQIRTMVHDLNKLNKARLNLIQMVRTGNHVARKRKKSSSEMNAYQRQYLEFELQNDQQASSTSNSRSLFRYKTFSKTNSSKALSKASTASARVM